VLDKLLDLYYFKEEEYLFLLGEANFAKKQVVHVANPPYNVPNQLWRRDPIPLFSLNQPIS